jgi:hypothetical protein
MAGLHTGGGLKLIMLTPGTGPAFGIFDAAGGGHGISMQGGLSVTGCGSLSIRLV